MTDLAKLKELAETAGSQTPPSFWTDGAGERERTWSEFYANANPAAILALISRLEEAEKTKAAIKVEWDKAEKDLNDLRAERATLTAQRDEAVGALEKSIKDTGFLISVINGVRSATGEGPEEEDAAIFWQINHDYVSRHAQDVVARLKGGE